MLWYLVIIDLYGFCSLIAIASISIGVINIASFELFKKLFKREKVEMAKMFMSS